MVLYFMGSLLLIGLLMLEFIVIVIKLLVMMSEELECKLWRGIVWMFYDYFLF